MALSVLPTLLLPTALLHAAPVLVAHRVRSSRCALAMSEQDDGESLAEAFASERARRAANGGEGDKGEGSTPSERPFTGVQEVILDESGQPVAIPRRPPPPAQDSPRDSIMDLVQNPLFAFGVLVSIGSVALLLAIAAADDAALGF